MCHLNLNSELFEVEDHGKTKIKVSAKGKIAKQ